MQRGKERKERREKREKEKRKKREGEKESRKRERERERRKRRKRERGREKGIFHLLKLQLLAPRPSAPSFASEGKRHAFLSPFPSQGEKG